MYSFPNKRLVFRADGNSIIGLGHLVRLLALADLLRGLAPGFFLVREPSQAIVQMIVNAGWSIHTLPGESSLLLEANWLAQKYLHSGDVVVLDGYEFTLAYQQCLRQTGCGLVYVDDLHAWPVVADVLINHSPGVTSADYQASPSACLLLGPAFSLLRQPFFAAVAPPQPPGSITSALICFGGADPLGLTARTLAALLAVPALQRVAVVVGGAFGDEAALRHLAAQQSGQLTEIYRNVDATELVTLMQAHTLVIAPASTVLIEALVLGRLALTGYYADNQQALANYVHTHQQAFSVGDFTTLGGQALTTSLHRGLTTLATQPRQPYTDRLRPELVRAEVQRLLDHQP